MLEDLSPVIYCTLLIFFGAVLWHAFLWAIFSGLTETLEKIQCFVDGLKQTINIIAIPFLWVFRKHIAHHFQTPFPFEDLPPEIAWKIIDYVPEAVLCLRAASRSMKSCVDQYAVLCQINLVKSLSILPDNEFTRSVWHYSWEVSEERDCALLITLRECFGKQINRVTVGTFEQPNESIGAVRILLQGVLIKKLQVVCSVISESVVNYTFAAVAHFNVDELTVTYQMGETQRTVGFFIGISEHIRSLHICQMTVQGPHPFAHLDRHINWLPVILEIFSSTYRCSENAFGLKRIMWIPTCGPLSLETSIE
ncbi:hypothetical protein PRIPAC_73285 [Pristionchus pacificus]|uniref:Uncharacterized protein n=1 Tax=Pristionchus pacificus TaxID=54126 RepID=A0A2A6C753_PRIPA|nr:hypothetical protein PRIPAC_73285 [Pristionchus pacificus]|eukprot:PDM73851.1 hypothetical protein PRIPAC_41207 [Pristionchus pacificus]